MSSPNITRNPDVVVVGGGVIGLASAWRLAQRGVRVAVVDPEPGRGASWVAAGMLPPVTEVNPGEEATLGLNLASSRMYPAFVEELEEASGDAVGYRTCGMLVVARDRDEDAALEDLASFQRGLGLDVRRLKGWECRELEPALSPRVRGGILSEEDHQVDSRALVHALERACTRSGVEIVADEVAEVLVESDRAVGVSLASRGRMDSSTVVLAAGCRSGMIAGIPSRFLPPVRPVKGQVLHLRDPDPRAPSLAEHNIRSGHVYIVPRGDGRYVIGATVEEQGFDTSVTAGGILGLLHDAWEVLPGVAELRFEEAIAGLRPGSPDNAPIIGASGLEGLIVATGHYRFGILLTPITATAVADLIVEGQIHDAMAPFSPARFERAPEVVS